MKKLWSMLFFLNLMPLSWVYFLIRGNITLQFKSDELTRFFLTGPEYVKKALYIIWGVNVALYFVFKAAKRTNVLTWLPFPNRGYWLSTPDLRLDTLVKIQDSTVLIGVFANCLLAFTQFYIFIINFYPKMLKASTLQLYSGVMVAIALCNFLFIFLEFSLPPEAKKQA